ncbi:WGR domain-containing protein [Defluviimonas salinarum]|uniref:NAD(+) ADP-ribosyltransferase n=1 Tax=Defluviimonas salinarum TaxID=2992147 RepID=A0ABT3J890_9RHOB|nr:WGR domain-containing protein [Defluviimonas salinarum]MCW3783594.1 WGR domain-containing protein [Defluviimonas salinarum]
MHTAETRMYILTDTQANNNKFWEVSIDAGGSVSSRNGRVGSAGQSRVLGAGQNLFQAKIREKERKGYRQVEIVAGAGASGLDGAALATAAEDEIARGNPVLAALVRELAGINRHQILAASGGQMSLDLTTGIISTPVGVVTAANVAKARTLIGRFERFVEAQDFDHPGFLETLEEYLMLVPQKVGSRRGWHRDFITGMESLVQQSALLDQLDASIGVATQRIRDAANSPDAAPKGIFDVRMSVSEDPGLRAHVQAFFERGRNRSHASHRLGMARIFEVSLGSMDRDYEDDGAKVGGVMELWHGTRAHNLMSILKSGLIIPKSNGSIHVTGRMFGDGLYFSDQSTKSLNYAYGYWDGGAKDSRCYMFLADVAMGRPWHPDRTGSNVKPPAGHDSVYARGGQDRVMNNEMIVYRTSQARLKYLVEFQQ